MSHAALKTKWKISCPANPFPNGFRFTLTKLKKDGKDRIIFGSKQPHPYDGKEWDIMNPEKGILVVDDYQQLPIELTCGEPSEEYPQKDNYQYFLRRAVDQGHEHNIYFFEVFVWSKQKVILVTMSIDSGAAQADVPLHGGVAHGDPD